MLLEKDVLTVLCPAEAESPAYHTLRKNDRNRDGNNPLPHRSKSTLTGSISPSELNLYIAGSLTQVIHIFNYQLISGHCGE